MANADQLTRNYKTISIAKENMVGMATINRPPENRVTLEMMHEIMDAVRIFDADPDVRLIMLKAAGPDFSLGGDVEEALNLEGWEANEFFFVLVKMAKSLRAAAKPTMAVVHGRTAAAGMVTAMNCDLVIAADDTQMGSTAINFGLICPFGPATIMPRQVGTKRSFELGAIGCLVPVQELYEHGVVNRVVPVAKLDQEAMKFASEITSKSPTAMLLHKKLFYAAQDMEYGKALDLGAATMVQYQMTPEAKEGMRAFLENRTPNWDIDGYTGDYSVRRKQKA